MLIIKAFVNHDQIDEIHVQRVENLSDKGIYEYRVRKPEGFLLPVYHAYADGAWILTEKVLRYINNAK